MWSMEQIIGAVNAVIVAGMPAMIALLKIRELHILVNSRLSSGSKPLTKCRTWRVGSKEDEGRKAAAVESATIRQYATDKAKVLAEAPRNPHFAESAEKAHLILAEAANEALEKQQES